MKKLPTHEDCLNIVKNNEAFFKKEYIINGTKIDIFSYRLANYTDFIKYNAFELRGLTFVNENNEWKKYLALNKFFNINQTTDWMLEDVINKKIISIDDKLDGSMIHFILLNDKVIAKTKMSFESDQAIETQKIIDNDKKLYNFIYTNLKKDISLIFEFISPFNQIVLQYKKTELVLLQARDQHTGKYIDFKELNIPKSLKRKESFPLISLEELMKKKEYIEKIEGWVITFEDGQKAKIKTEWYFRLHGLIGDNISYPNLLIEIIVNEQIDDVLAELDENSEKRLYIENVVKKINHYYNQSFKEIEKLIDLFNNKYNKNKKDFALANRQNDFFGIVMNVIKGNEIEKNLKNYIIKNTNKANKAEDFLNNIKLNEKKKINKRKSKNIDLI